MSKRSWSIATLLLVVLFGWWLVPGDNDQTPTSGEAEREKATDLIVDALDKALRATESDLRNPDAVRAAAITPDSITLIREGTTFEALPHGRLLFYPEASPGFPSKDAEEIIRAAADLQRRGAHDAALAAYAKGMRMAWTATGDVPTELFARAARCELLAATGRTSDLRMEALELRELLLDGRWRITRPAFTSYLQSASRWAFAGERPAIERFALSEVVDRLYGAGSFRPVNAGLNTSVTSSRSTMSAGGVQFTVLVQTTGTRTTALIAGPLYVEHVWKAQIKSVEDRNGVSVALDEEGATTRPKAETSRRETKSTGLPWPIIVTENPSNRN